MAVVQSEEKAGFDKGEEAKALRDLLKRKIRLRRSRIRLNVLQC